MTPRLKIRIEHTGSKYDLSLSSGQETKTRKKKKNQKSVGPNTRSSIIDGILEVRIKLLM